ncbi:hypothetical protein M0R45_025649 [Rubus argutus]|uniref:MHC class I antigen n=1 Tax=Rubus argutus TaxID=59490 RepID=A0AAW1WYL9_RUBAR
MLGLDGCYRDEHGFKLLGLEEDRGGLVTGSGGDGLSTGSMRWRRRRLDCRVMTGEVAGLGDCWLIELEVMDDDWTV